MVAIMGNYNLYYSYDWKEYEFYYKPGDLTSISPIAIPHQPRLDW